MLMLMLMRGSNGNDGAEGDLCSLIDRQIGEVCFAGIAPFNINHVSADTSTCDTC